MLQSPLNRKVNQSNMRGRNEYYYRNVDNGYQIKTPGDPYTDTQKATNTFPQYNSYSSDDEGRISFAYLVDLIEDRKQCSSGTRKHCA